MIRFRVFGLPRSGTTWAANWLTTDASICWHDPCEWAVPPDIDAWAKQQQRIPGISCTGSWLHPDWTPDAPTICLTRDPPAVQASLRRVGLPEIPHHLFHRFADLPYPFYTLADLLDPDMARTIWAKLLPTLPFDAQRHAELSKMNIQPCEHELGRIRTACQTRPE